MRRKVVIVCFLLMLLFLVGCSSEDVNPEDTLKKYINSWSNGSYENMLTLLSKESIEMVDNQKWRFSERYKNIYNDLEIDEIKIDFQKIDFKGEGIDLDEITEITYLLDIKMNSVAGKLKYQTEVDLVKEAENEDEEGWYVVWHPSHLLKGLEEPTDKINLKIEQPQRGEIFDRNGKELAVNGKILQVSVVPEATKELEQTAENLAEELDMDVEKVLELSNQYSHRPDWAAPIQNLSLDDPRKESLLDIDGVLISQVDGRQYPYGDAVGHLTGHIGPITAEELKERQGQGYRASSFIGKNSLELVYEEKLRGTPGATITAVDINGNERKIIAEQKAIDGEDITLSIDVDIQQKILESLSGKSGAGIVMEPKTGEVLAMVSEPAFDPNLRYLGLPDPRADKIEDTSRLFERRFQNKYSPGSVFKPFTAIMGIEENTLVPNDVLKIDGLRWQPDSSWGGYHITRVSDVNKVNLNNAMIYSDNIYFAKQALKLGGDKLEQWTDNFGFGQNLNFEFPLHPSKLSNSDLKSDVLLADTGYGQGELQMSPLHLTAMYTVFLNDGDMIQPTLIAEEQTRVFKADVASSQTADIVLDTLKQVVENEKGTAYRENPGHNRKIAGKTGTAELKKDFKEKDGDILGWYVSFDYEDKDMLITLMVEDVSSSSVVDMANDFWKMAD
ncbi:penicillin-binding transpeptidase domain-containing protein [Proteinivorax tanatarense]|uniref:Penicillin-binding transpeptidase domain-containing protein n=1 Tax=Proteinivorax tanatarense TaxID=1260629 RepID=A0AAU7VKX4_9FIRM